MKKQTFFSIFIILLGFAGQSHAAATSTGLLEKIAPENINAINQIIDTLFSTAMKRPLNEQDLQLLETITKFGKQDSTTKEKILQIINWAMMYKHIPQDNEFIKRIPSVMEKIIDLPSFLLNPKAGSFFDFWIPRTIENYSHLLLTYFSKAAKTLTPEQTEHLITVLWRSIQEESEYRGQPSPFLELLQKSLETTTNEDNKKFAETALRVIRQLENSST